MAHVISIALHHHMFSAGQVAEEARRQPEVADVRVEPNPRLFQLSQAAATRDPHRTRPRAR